MTNTKTPITESLAAALDGFADVLREVTLESTTGLPTSALQEVSIVLSSLSQTLSEGFAGCVVHDRDEADVTISKSMAALQQLSIALFPEEIDG